MTEMIQAGQLLRGNLFKELSDSPKDKPARVQENPEPCVTEFANVHVKTSRGDWCIARQQLLILKG